MDYLDQATERAVQRRTADHEAAVRQAAEAQQRCDDLVQLAQCREIEQRAREAHVQAAGAVKQWEADAAARRAAVRQPYIAAGSAALATVAGGLWVMTLAGPILTAILVIIMAAMIVNRLRYPHRLCTVCAVEVSRRRSPMRNCPRCRRVHKRKIERRERREQILARGTDAELARRTLTLVQARDVHGDALTALFHAELRVPLHEVWPQAGFAPTEVIR